MELENGTPDTCKRENFLRSQSFSGLLMFTLKIKRDSKALFHLTHKMETPWSIERFGDVYVPCNCL